MLVDDFRDLSLLVHSFASPTTLCSSSLSFIHSLAFIPFIHGSGIHYHQTRSIFPYLPSSSNLPHDVVGPTLTPSESFYASNTGRLHDQTDVLFFLASFLVQCCSCIMICLPTSSYPLLKTCLPALIFLFAPWLVFLIDGNIYRQTGFRTVRRSLNTGLYKVTSDRLRPELYRLVERRSNAAQKAFEYHLG